MSDETTITYTDARRCASCGLRHRPECTYPTDVQDWWEGQACYVPPMLMTESVEAGLQAIANERATDPVDVTPERGARYGHPSDHFTRTVAILGIVFGAKRMCDLSRRDWPVIMECDKLARFAQTLDDDDSQVDVGGYSKTYFMAEAPPSDETLEIMRTVLTKCAP